MIPNTITKGITISDNQTILFQTLSGELGSLCVSVSVISDSQVTFLQESAVMEQKMHKYWSFKADN